MSTPRAEPGIVEIGGVPLDLTSVEQVARGARVRLAEGAKERVDRARAVVDRLVAGAGREHRKPAYGVNTGFGALAEVPIEVDQLRALQRNLVLSHACGTGAPYPVPVVRAMMLLRAQTLAAGHSGVRRLLVERLVELLNRRVHPVIPSQGSVGASGDLAPLAHLALTVIGEGETVIGDGDPLIAADRLAAGDALARAGLAPLELEAKEGLSLVNGTQAMTAQGALALAAGARLCQAADLAGAMSLDALLGTPRAFDARIEQLRPHPGQATSAHNLRLLLLGSAIVESHRDCKKVQDPYSLRCMPQVHGATRDALRFCEVTLVRELGACTDNPLVFAPESTSDATDPSGHDAGEVLSGGNFHGQPIALALDFAAIALAELANISERRIEQLVNPHYSSGLPPFLVPSTALAGLNSGFMLAQVTAAALVSENKILCHPASVDSIPSSAGREDHVSMGVTAARKLADVVRHVETVLGIELLCAAQGIDLRRPLRSSAPLEAAWSRLRAEVPRLDADRPLYVDIEKARRLVASGELVDAAAAAFVNNVLAQVLTVGALHVGNRRFARRGPAALPGTSRQRAQLPRLDQEAALRMLMNNLDPEVAERPEDLVVYGGSGKAARSWQAFDVIVNELRRLGHDETLLVQSGKAVGVLKTHDDAPRVLLCNSNLVPAWARWDEFRRLEALGLTMFGQMTAGSWIYIGTQGILQGTYETFAQAARTHYGPEADLSGRWVLSGGLGGMGGAQPLAVTMAGGVFLGIDVDPQRIERRLAHGYLDEVATSLDDALTRAEAARTAKRPLSIGLCDNAATVYAELARRGVVPDLVTDQTSAHDPLNGYVPESLSLDEARRLRQKDPELYIRRAQASMVSQVRAMIALGAQGAHVFDYGNNLRGGAVDGGLSRAEAFSYPGFVPAYIRPLFCEGKGPFRWVALSGDPEDIRTTDRALLELFPENKGLWRWLKMAGEKVHFQGLPARICWLGYGDRHRAGLRFNELVKSGQVKAPIVIGRDHLDSGSVASPYRETEGMRDGSDAIADWPLLNALVNTAAGASWVSIHHGGGVGIGLSIHAGMVVVADGTESQARRLERVLTTDPAMGILRHADAGYEQALAMADEHGVHIPHR